MCLAVLSLVAVAVQAAPSPDPAYQVVPVVPSYQGKYHAQDELGQYSFGHHEPNQVRHESKDAAGVVRGSYSYLGADGATVTNHYIADENGFRSSLAPSNGPVLPVTGKISGVPVTATAAHPVVQVAEPVVYTSPAVKVAHVATPTIYTASHYKVAPAAHVVHSGYPYATYGTRYLSYSPYYTPYAYAAHAW